MVFVCPQYSLRSVAKELFVLRMLWVLSHKVADGKKFVCWKTFERRSIKINEFFV